MLVSSHELQHDQWDRRESELGSRAAGRQGCDRGRLLSQVGGLVLILRARGSWLRIIRKVRMSSDLSAAQVTLVSMWRIDGRIVRNFWTPNCR